MFEGKRLGGMEQRQTIEAPKKSNKFEFASKKKYRRFKMIYKAYLVSTAALVLAVLMLFFFGVSSSGNAIGGRASLVWLADKVGDWVLDSYFKDFSSEQYDSTDNADEPSSSNKNDIDSSDTQKPSVESGAPKQDIYAYDRSIVPEGQTPIVPMDLSLSGYGETYINNSTGYTPDISWLLKKDVHSADFFDPAASKEKPLVLIVHTHGTEAYSSDGALYFPTDKDNYARSEDVENNVVAIGKTVAKILSDNGIPTAHCAVMHDSVQYKDSYARAEETIRRYLDEYPSIKLVIDIHRDSIVRSNGDLIRPVAEYNGEALAQMMCVVGSDWTGQECDNWENNLSLALKLRQKLNSTCENICRPTTLKPNTYNQEISDLSLLIEVGSSGNSLEEGMRSAKLLGEALSDLIKDI